MGFLQVFWSLHGFLCKACLLNSIYCDMGIDNVIEMLQNINNKDSAESPWRSGGGGRGSRGGRMNFSSRHASNGK